MAPPKFVLITEKRKRLVRVIRGDFTKKKVEKDVTLQAEFDNILNTYSDNYTDQTSVIESTTLDYSATAKVKKLFLQLIESDSTEISDILELLRILIRIDTRSKESSSEGLISEDERNIIVKIYKKV
jgi:hypothetical protein